MQSTDIAIIGAGLAGLTCAHVLHAQGLTVAVIDAADRIGGRILSLRDADGTALADLGPTWIWPPHQPVVAHWLDRLDLATFDQANAARRGAWKIACSASRSARRIEVSAASALPSLSRSDRIRPPMRSAASKRVTLAP